ncbi:DNA-directed DNA polymerase alpha subunit pol12 [Mycoemilia scoparia]|uniref:DNA polymerase alpha subunit B n=1 Tax=Mycoemilia scoparia TaxID=417184 RepID=A0A9W8AA55_9FUNG|nr:DNA-directed DNA polymerase alpha subunit pol12 [Mycoemilia scoparia]
MISATNNQSIKDSIKQQFSGTTIPDDALAECESICQTFALSAQDLYVKWQKFLINSYGGSTTVQITKDRLLQLRQEVQRDQGQKILARPSQGNRLSRNRNKVHDKHSIDNIIQKISTTPKIRRLADPATTPKSHNRVGLLKAENGDAANGGIFSPNSLGSPTQQSPSATRFLERTNNNKIETILHPHLQQFSSKPDAEPLQIFVANPDLIEGLDGGSDNESKDDDTADLSAGLQNKRFRYMFEKIRNGVDSLEQRIESVIPEIKQGHNIASLGNPTYSRQDVVTAVGRICNDSSESNVDEPAHLTDTTVTLETSRRIGAGRRVPLNLKMVPSFAFFPGQIVALRGKNLDGKEFVVTEILDIPRLQASLTEVAHHEPREFTMAVASGPYTLSDNLEYDTLRELMSKLAEDKPDIVVLMGPFISESHPQIQQGSSDLSPSEIFSQKVLPQLALLKKSLHSHAKIAIVPSPDDLCLPFACYPQPIPDKLIQASLGTLNVAEFWPNPAQVVINGTSFAFNNIDTLLQIGSEEVARMPKYGDRLPRLARHCIEQRHFYPLFPPHKDANISLGYDSRAYLLGVPDVLFTPSKLHYFAKVADSVVCINPGKLTKGLSGGTYARLWIYGPESKTYPKNNTAPMDLVSQAMPDIVSNSSEDRIRAQIIRL